jgi:Putative metallopeptidase
MFDLLDVPVFGRAEDAADGFATYMMLNLGKQDAAQRLILGAAYSYRDYVNPRVCVPLIAFADAHGAPMQRYYILLCIGYGADPQLFAGLIEKGYLPKDRADSCRIEYKEVYFAFSKVIAPHLDEELAKQVLDKTWLPCTTVPCTIPPSPPPVSLRPVQPSVGSCSR